MQKKSSSVQDIETTACKPPPSSYQEFRRSKCEDEWQRTVELYSHIDSTEGSHRTDALGNCRTFAYFARNKESGKVRVISNACRLRWCPLCAAARSRNLQLTLQGWLESKKNPKFLTLTLKHSSAPLEHQVRFLYDHFRKFRQRLAIRKLVRGGIWFFQVKRSLKTGQWHPHLHCAIDSDYVPQSLLSSEWYKQTLTSDIVDIRVIRDAENTAGYVARYASRPAKLSDYKFNDSIEIFTVLHGRRLCGTWGTGKQMSLRPSKVSEASDWQKIGDYSTVVKRSVSIRSARKVLEAWQSNSALPNYFAIRSAKGRTIDDKVKVDVHLILESMSSELKEFIP